MSIYLVLFSVVRSTRQDNRRKKLKGEVKSSLFSDDILVYIRNTKKFYQKMSKKLIISAKYQATKSSYKDQQLFYTSNKLKQKLWTHSHLQYVKDNKISQKEPNKGEERQLQWKLKIFVVRYERGTKMQKNIVNWQNYYHENDHATKSNIQIQIRY